MPKPSAVLPLLRQTPLLACTNWGFTTEFEDNTLNSAGGGPCAVTCASQPGSDDVFRLVITRGGGDWFYPFRSNGQGGLGNVRVPAGQAADGALVVTGGMNGCALQVNYDNGFFIFYHDSDGCSFTKTGATAPGTMVCRLTYKDYAGPLEMGVRTTSSYMEENKGSGAEFFHTLITVKEKGRWKVYVTGILATTQGSKSKKYSVFRPHITPLLTSFADDDPAND